METLKLTLALVFIVKYGYSQMISPCPRYFSYEPKNPNEPDRWYGQIILNSDAELQGVWLRVAFDRPTLQLGNWFGEVVRREQNEYLIKNPRQKLFPNQPMTVRFFVKFNPGDVPQFTGFRLNAKTYCPEGSATTVPPLTQGQLFTNSDSGSTQAPNSGQSSGGSNWNGGGGGGSGGGGSNGGGSNGGGSNGGGSGGGVNFGGGGGGSDFRPNRPGDGDEVFPGDFTIINRPTTNLLEGGCGTVIQQPRPLITHGQLSHEAEFPWHAALYHAAGKERNMPSGIDLTYICGASLITKQHLLTVAHCVTKRGSSNTLNPDSLVVYLGKHYLKKWSNPGIQDRHIAQIFPHPNYNAHTYSDDIAVLKLIAPAEITNYVRPVCLWEGDANLQNVVNKQGTVVGWGYNESGIVTDQLMKANMPIVSQETCIYSFPDFFSRFTNSKTFCAGFRNGTSVCNGDSGGGMVIPKSGGNNPVWQIRGLVSISVALQNTFKCDSNHYVVFTDVAKYVDWIKATLR